MIQNILTTSVKRFDSYLKTPRVTDIFCVRLEVKAIAEVVV